MTNNLAEYDYDSLLSMKKYYKEQETVLLKGIESDMQKIHEIRGALNEIEYEQERRLGYPIECQD